MLTRIGFTGYLKLETGCLMRGAGCPTAFCGSSGALVWLQTALMCLNYTHNNNENCNNNNINRVTVSQGKKTTRWPVRALTWTLSATRKWIRVGSETWSSQGIWYGGGEGIGYRVPGTGNRELGSGNLGPHVNPSNACQSAALEVTMRVVSSPLCPCPCSRLAFGFFQRKRLTNLMQASFFRVFLPQAEPFLHSLVEK